MPNCTKNENNNFLTLASPIGTETCTPFAPEEYEYYAQYTAVKEEVW